MDAIIDEVEDGLENIFHGEKHSHTHLGVWCKELHPKHHILNRYDSFAPQSSGHVKWYVDGCSYFWAVSQALQGEHSFAESHTSGTSRLRWL